MLKKAVIPLIIFFLLAVSSTPVDASILVIEKSGKVLWNVLSASDENLLKIPKYSSLAISKIGSEESGSESVVSLNRQEERINMTVTANNETKQLDISNWKSDIIEIEERPEVQKVKISMADGKFSLNQKGISALTSSMITIDSRSAELSIKTESGNKYLSILPYDAVQTLLKTKVVSEITDNKIDIVEENGSLAYKILGNKVINFFDIYYYRIPVSSFISASSGEVLKIDSPTFYKYLTFLFV